MGGNGHSRPVRFASPATKRRISQTTASKKAGSKLYARRQEALIINDEKPEKHQDSDSPLSCHKGISDSCELVKPSLSAMLTSDLLLPPPFSETHPSCLVNESLRAPVKSQIKENALISEMDSYELYCHAMSLMHSIQVILSSNLERLFLQLTDFSASVDQICIEIQQLSYVTYQVKRAIDMSMHSTFLIACNLQDIVSQNGMISLKCHDSNLFNSLPTWSWKLIEQLEVHFKNFFMQSVRGRSYALRLQQRNLRRYIDDNTDTFITVSLGHVESTNSQWSKVSSFRHKTLSCIHTIQKECDHIVEGFRVQHLVEEKSGSNSKRSSIIFPYMCLRGPMRTSSCTEFISSQCPNSFVSSDLEELIILHRAVIKVNELIQDLFRAFSETQNNSDLISAQICPVIRSKHPSLICRSLEKCEERLTKSIYDLQATCSHFQSWPLDSIRDSFSELFDQLDYMNIIQCTLRDIHYTLIICKFLYHPSLFDIDSVSEHFIMLCQKLTDIRPYMKKLHERFPFQLLNKQIADFSQVPPQKLQAWVIQFIIDSLLYTIDLLPNLLKDLASHNLVVWPLLDQQTKTTENLSKFVCKEKKHLRDNDPIIRTQANRLIRLLCSLEKGLSLGQEFREDDLMDSLADLDEQNKAEAIEDAIADSEVVACKAGEIKSPEKEIVVSHTPIAYTKDNSEFVKRIKNTNVQSVNQITTVESEYEENDQFKSRSKALKSRTTQIQKK